MERYIAVQEPCCTWAVFDTRHDVPAEFGGAVLVGLDGVAAAELATSANAGRLRMRETCLSGSVRLVVRLAA